MQESPWLDTEVFTNIVVKASQNELRKIDVDMQFIGSPTNNVQIAFGHDVDHDGDLADEETQLVFGWKCGRRFLSLPPNPHIAINGLEFTALSSMNLTQRHRAIEAAKRNMGIGNRQQCNLTPWGVSSQSYS